MSAPDPQDVHASKHVGGTHVGHHRSGELDQLTQSLRKTEIEAVAEVGQVGQVYVFDP
ncbi:hypothetical protein J1C56_00710 [Aminobacter anthyllidis]|uniref:Uncharacterized protein n=1 Tax=Aminobacter anthyllidis TaxID=1035067 RepID=A0A9X1A6S2_9HYPH|nr:hypothetical protein [Aminobacter anthyllidis]MBT1154106.1 hypothetical protein [Aminobacter anthyllidis]